MKITIALAGNPNCGKTTMFNNLTGSAQYVGNWPGVTVEKKEGRLKEDKEVIIQDLPGIYSLSPYTLEEVVSRNYLVKERPDAIINIVDGTNIERNLYLTTQLQELGIPMVIALNMIDIVKKSGDKIDVEALSKKLGCPVIETSALKGEGSLAAVKKAIEQVKDKKAGELPHVFTGSVEHAIAHIEESIQDKVDQKSLRWYAVKLFERDAKVQEQVKLSKDELNHIEQHIVDCEKEMDDDAESIITNQRYAEISKIVDACVVKNVTNKSKSGVKMSVSDKIDKIVTNRWLALPIFVIIMGLVYYISVTTIGTIVTDWTNDTLFGEMICGNLQALLDGANVAPWLSGLLVDGIVGGVGAVIGFVPQMLVLFFLLALLEDVGYMARIAFIMDRIFKKFGLSGKSFIPMLISSGCGVPGIMASRTIENERDRRMTIMTTTFIPCGAKMPIIALFAGAIFNGSWVIATASYFLGVFAVVVSGIILKKTKAFAGDPSPFVMELPSYHFPAMTNVLRSTWDRGWSFIKRAGTVIVLSTIVIWFLQNFGIQDGSFGMVDEEVSFLAAIGNAFAPIFSPIGFGNWKATVATVSGLVAKENVVGTFGVLYGFAEVAEDGAEIWGNLASSFTSLTAISFMVFNLLCAPCFAAMGAIKTEMNSAKWTLGAIGYMCGFAYAMSLMIYQFGLFFTGNGFTIGTAVALVVLLVMLFLLLRPNPYKKAKKSVSSVEALNA